MREPVSGQGRGSGSSAAKPILVFVGPTLPLADAQGIIEAVFLRPVAQGDIILAAHAFRPRAMVVIDGQFEDRPPVRHKEILWALAQGIVVIGAASLGALRAAELHPLGMIGVGRIFRWYRRWPLAPDDAVATQSAPAELGFLPLTDSMVDLQATFRKMCLDGLISPGERLRLTGIARSLNFRERRLDEVLRLAGYAPQAAATFAPRLVRQKRHDALEALGRAPGLVEEAMKKARPPWVATNTFLRDLEAGGIDPQLLCTYG